MATNAPASRLTKASKGKLAVPLRYVVYGAEGVGKSTLAAHAPKPIWLDIEDGSGRLDVARYPFRDGDGGHVPQSYPEILAAIDDLAHNPHEYKTLVIDTADRLESLMWRWILERDSGKSSALNKGGKTMTSIEDYGYGKGYQLAVDDWRALCLKLDRLRMIRGISIIFLAHTQIRTFKNPTGDDYDRWVLRINDKAGGFLKEWADVTAFATFEESAGKLPGDDGRSKGYSTGRRLLKLERTAAFDAKSRIPLPAEVELDAGDPWGPLRKAVEEGMGVDPAVLKSQIEAEVARIGDPALGEKVAAAVKENPDAGSLSRYLQKLKRTQPAVAAAG
jgi:hypothetical protein